MAFTIMLRSPRTSDPSLFPWGSQHRPGLLKAINMKGYWAWENTDNGVKDLRWIHCLTPAECLPHEKCIEGQTGPICRVCLPSFTRAENDHTCAKCPNLIINLIITGLFFVAGTVSVYVLTFGVIFAAGKPKAIHAVLLKLLLNYSTTMSVLYALFTKTVSHKKGTFQEAIGFARSMFSSLDYDGSAYVETPTWRPDCLFDIFVPYSREDEALVNSLAHVRHSEFFLDVHKPARELLTKTHHDVEFLRMLFWMVYPVVFAVVIYSVGFICVVYHLKSNKLFYMKVLRFYVEVRTDGFAKAHKELKHEGECEEAGEGRP